MDTSDLITLDQLGLADPTPAPAPDLLGYANTQLYSGKSPDDALQATMDKYGEGNPFDFTYDPTSKQFKDNAPAPTEDGLIPLDSLDLSAKVPTTPVITPTPTTKPTKQTSPLDDPNSIWYISPSNREQLGLVSQDLKTGIGNVAEDVKNAGLDIGQYFTNFGKEHETVTPGPATPKEAAAAKLLGVSLTASPSTYPGLDTLSNPTGLGRGSVYKLSPAEQQELSDTYYKAHGGSDEAEQERIAKTDAGDAGSYDPVSTMLGDDPLIKLLAFPRLANTQKYYLIQDTVHNMDVVSDPSKYSPKEVKQAQQFIDAIKKEKGESVFKGLQDTWKKLQDNPEETGLGLAAGIAQNPALLAAPEARVGDLILGKAATKAAQTAETAGRLGKLGIEAAPGASDFASKVAAQTQRRATRYAALADRAQAARRALSASQSVLNTAGASAAGAAINTGATESQELATKGTVQPGTLISPAAIGAIAGGGLAALGGRASLADERMPGGARQPQGAEAAPAAERAAPSVSNTLNKMDMFGRIKPVLPAAALGAGLYGYGQLSGNEDAKKGAMFLPFAALGKMGESGAKEWRVDDIHNYKLAKDLSNKGADPKDIYFSTGYFKNADGQLVKEIDDSQYKMNGDILKDRQPHSLGEVIEHSELAQHVPSLMKGVKVQELLSDAPKGVIGSYDHKTHTIYVPSEEQIVRNKFTYGGQPITQRQVLIHELQHAVQEQYGMARGGSPVEFKAHIEKEQSDLNNELNRLHGEYKEAIADGNQRYATTIQQEMNKVGAQFKTPEQVEKEAENRYLRLQGENQAYATENRLDLSQKERQLLYPESHMPAKVKNQIVRYNPGEYTVAEHLSRTGEMDEDGKLRGMVLSEDKLPNESDVVARAKEGNQQAVSSLYKQYVPRLTRTLGTLLRGKTGSTLGLEAEDIAHIAFTRAVSSLPNYRGDSSFYTYLYSIAKNAAFEALGRAKRTPQIGSLERTSEGEVPSTAPLTGKDEELLSREYPMGPKPQVENIPDTSGTPEEHAVAQQTSKILGHVLDNLPKDIRNTVKLVDLVGMTNEEAAKALGVPVGTIKSRLHNAEKLIERSIQSGHGAQFRKQGGYATPEALQKLLKTGALLGVGAYLGSQLSSPGHEGRGALYGAFGAIALGNISPKNMWRDVRTALSPHERVNVNYLLNDWDARRAGMDLLVSRVQYQIDRLAPGKESQRKITYWLDGDKTIHLTPKERQAALVAKSFYDKVLGEGLETGILKSFLENYINHEWVEPKLAQKLHEELANSFPTNMSPKDKHALARSFLTLEKGKQAGLTPRTENVNDLIAIYGRSMARAMANKALLEGLKNHTLSVKNGIKAVMPAAKAPYNFVAINHPQLAGLRVSPDLAPSLRFLFHQTGGGVLNALEGLNIALKREETGLSLFHPYALTMAFLTANPFTQLLRNTGQLGKSFVGKTDFHKSLLTDGTTLEQFIQGGMDNGLKLSLRKGQVSDEDVNTGFYQGLQQLQNFLDRNIPLGAQLGHGVRRLYNLSDKLVWENVHTGLKGTTFMNAYERLLKNNQEALNVGRIKAMPTKSELYRQAASFTNDIFGGLNWRRLADDATTRIGRLAALAVATPLARRIGQVMLFAPDWTYSTIRSFVKAFGPGSGFRGVLKPRELADLHRQYLLRNAVLYFTLYNALNTALSGHPIWENKDPLTVDMGKGERLYINKHFMEVPHAIMNPGKFVLGKLGTIPSEALEQALKVDYLNPDHMPPMKNRLEHAIRRFEPFGVQTLQTEGPKAAMLSLSGMPVYGGHRELDPEEQLAKKQAKRAAARKAAKTREKHEMEKLMRGEF